jgi:DNA-binding NarL/FixJ family response regulator
MGGLGAETSPAMVPVQRGDDGAPMDLRSAGSAEDSRFRQPDPRDNLQAGRFGREEPATRRTALTERELQVLRGMADGKSNAEIGRELFVSEDTVKTHARRLFRKLGARDRAHAVAAGFRTGLVA